MASQIAGKRAAKSQENVWLNIGFNIIAPTIILTKGKGLFIKLFGEGFDPAHVTQAVFVAALLFPLFYGAYDLLKRGKWNIFSIVGIFSVLLTGGIGLFKLSRDWIIVKEAAVPLIIGLAVFASERTKKPLAKMLIMNDNVLDVARIEAAVKERGTQALFDRYLRFATRLVAGSFFISAALNYALASYIFKSEAGTDAFNEEVGRMTALSWPVIVVPTMLILIWALFIVFKAVKICTGLSLDDAMAEHVREKNASK